MEFLAFSRMWNLSIIRRSQTLTVAKKRPLKTQWNKKIPNGCEYLPTVARFSVKIPSKTVGITVSDILL